MYPLAFLMVMALWELYKWLGPDRGGGAFGVRLLPRTSDLAMPHVWDMFTRLTEPEVRGQESVLKVVAEATWYSFRLSLTAFVVGALLGIALAVLMARFKVIERALLPYLVISQTVPVIVLAPLIVSLMGYASADLASDRPWLAAVLLGVFLAFFPVAVATLRGLKAVEPAALDLMHSYAAGWWRTLFKLRFPSAAAYIAPSLRIAGAAAVVGVIVAEISIGLSPGVGRKILGYAQSASSDPPRLYTAVMGAAVLGIVMSMLVAGIDRYLRRNRPQEVTA